MKNFAFILILLASKICLAQNVPFKQLRYDEDYRYLTTDTSDSWYKRLKFAPVSKNKESFFSFGGEVRYQYFHFNNQDWGAAPEKNDGFILTRYLGHIDFHAGNHFRTFVQLQSSLANGEAESPSPVDQNLLDVHQAFVDLSDDNLTLRLGRQELSYGSQRLVSVREAPNNRQSFDAAKFMFAKGHSKFDLFFSYYVTARPDIFDDRINSGTRFWGAYSTFTNIPFLRNIDLYYLVVRKKTAVFEAGKGLEMRHSVGSRIWASTTLWQYDLEGVYQFGNFNNDRISAWTMSANISYTLKSSGLEPKIGVKTEAISGDRQMRDGRLNTFNPLFPKGAYFGLAALIGPSNLLDAHPYVELNISKNLVFTEDCDLFWRMSKNDGLYAVNGKLIYSGNPSQSRYIGWQLGSTLEYSPNKHLYLRQELTWFNAGDFIRASGPGKDILMTGSTITYKF
ncbi:hypothetical protein DYU05_06530 [Mucilaginibacter terrenus]|uniref:Alginate export domain-containing protein n=1 Tax=Mucilaginibacter terrenus TaxID=2482727 RepID=A0A3E2NWL5_9SPHI|nr:alginate export family protein [Mucilaginibacter terrenus]RFZ85250.1 hypothetical protein DYU05_06530 [Mucilaginibacter terrenus]